tara:strand:+ start:386 stop:643 length:258 start_codon:yes stop_codon:yes gene_type:complete
MIYAIKNKDGSLKGVTSLPQYSNNVLIPVASDFFSEYPQDCWIINDDDEVVLKEDAEAIKQAFLDNLNPPEEVIEPAEEVIEPAE